MCKRLARRPFRPLPCHLGTVGSSTVAGGRNGAMRQGHQDSWSLAAKKSNVLQLPKKYHPDFSSSLSRENFS